MRANWVIGFILWGIIFTGIVWAQEHQRPLTLEDSIKIALERSLALHSAQQGVAGSEFKKKEAITNFLPWWTGQYLYTRLNEEPKSVHFTPPMTFTEVKGSRDNYAFDTTLKQPLFTGGLNLANYRSAK